MTSITYRENFDFEREKYDNSAIHLHERGKIMVTTLYAGILGLIYAGFTLFVVKGRFKYQVNLGDGGDSNMMKRIRVHANFMEYVPIALLLMALAEIEGASEWLLHVLGIALLIGRIIHPLGVLKVVGPSVGRTGGMILTLLVIIVASIICIKSFFIL